jgi:hypothetical protein
MQAANEGAASAPSRLSWPGRYRGSENIAGGNDGNVEVVEMTRSEPKPRNVFFVCG